MSTSEGFGICGHKNSYPAGVCCGNWVEDSIGEQLSKEKRSIPITTKSETQENFIAYDLAAVRSSATANHTATQHLSKDILMNHREDGQIYRPCPNDRRLFKSTYSSIYGTRETPVGSILYRKKKLLLGQDQDPFQSETAQCMKAPFQPQSIAKISKPGFAFKTKKQH